MVEAFESVFEDAGVLIGRGAVGFGPPDPNARTTLAGGRRVSSPGVTGTELNIASNSNAVASGVV